MSRQTGKPHRICLMSSIPVTLWSFYRDLPAALAAEGWEVDIVASAGTELEKLAELADVRTFAVPIRRAIVPATDLRTISRLVRLFRERRYELIHAHTPKACLLGMVAATLAGVPVRLCTCHGLPLETEQGLRRVLLKNADRLAYSLAHRVLVVSPSLREKLQEHRVGVNAKLDVLLDGTACGVNLDRFTLSPQLAERAENIRRHHGFAPEDVVIGFVGRMVPDKGVHVLAESFRRLAEIHPHLRLLLVGGDESERGALDEATLETLTRHPKVVRVPFSYEVESYYAAMDVVALPTRREGFGYALLEAAAMKLPVVATRTTGCVDAVVDGETGLLVPPEDAAALAAALERLIASRSRRESMGAAGRQRVEARFDAPRYIQAHLDLYRKLTAESA